MQVGCKSPLYVLFYRHGQANGAVVLLKIFDSGWLDQKTEETTESISVNPYHSLCCTPSTFKSEIINLISQNCICVSE